MTYVGGRYILRRRSDRVTGTRGYLLRRCEVMSRWLISLVGILIAVSLSLGGCGDEEVESDDENPDSDHCSEACERIYGSVIDGGCQQIIYDGGDRVEDKQLCTKLCGAGDSVMQGTEKCIADESLVECKSEPRKMVDRCKAINDDQDDCREACRRVYQSVDDGGCQQQFYHEGEAVEGKNACLDLCREGNSLMGGTESCVADDSLVACQAEPDEMVDLCLPIVEEQKMCEQACERVYKPADEGGCQQSFYHNGGFITEESECADLCFEDETFMLNTQECIADESLVACQAEPGKMIHKCMAKEEVVVEACEHIEPWDGQAAKMENDLLALVNELRGEGVTCQGTGATMSATHSVSMDPHLRCAARLHSKNMVETGEFAHEIGGEGPGDRAHAAGYNWSNVGENIAQGQQTPQAVVDAWLSSAEGHCENLMSSSFENIGVGVKFQGGTPWWTLMLGAK